MNHYFKQIIKDECTALENLYRSGDNDETVNHYIQLMEERRYQKIVTTGIGKSSYVARKLAAMFCNVGEPAFYVHPVDILHGSLSRIHHDDLLWLVSHSGETEELVALMRFTDPYLRTILITSKPGSTLEKNSSLTFFTGCDEKLLVPTSSFTTLSVLADALVLSYAYQMGCTSKSTQQYHPAGQHQKVEP
jgi:arabinose-5-phosphate isomerase